MVRSASAQGALVGRADELGRLADLVGIHDGRAQPGAVLLSGDAGVGKTRLLDELQTVAQTAGWCAVVGHCLDFGDSALPYLPFREAFAGLQAARPDLTDVVTHEQPAVTRLLPTSGRVSDVVDGLGPRIDRTVLFEGVHAALTSLGAARPVLLVVEDVHWADRSTRELLSFLFTRRFTVPVSIVASYRTDDLHRRHPLRPVVAEWMRLPGVSRVQLSPLGAAEMRTLVRALGRRPLRGGDVQTVVDRAEGNPFFAEELLAAAEVGGGRVPADLADLLLLRLEQLDDAARLAVRVASVAGRRVTHRLLSQVVELDTETLDLALRAAVERHVLVPVAGDAVAFRHALLAEAVYDDLLPGERVRLHAAYVRALTAEDGDGPAAEVALHARAAHDTPTAVSASIRAGDEATAVAGPDEAARHYEVALELLGDPRTGADGREGIDEVDVVALTAKASEAATAAGHWHRAVTLVEHQLRQERDLTDLQRARLLLALATALLQSDADALVITTEALQLVPTRPPTPLRAHVLSVHARANADRSRDDDAARWASEALSLGRALELPDVMADATTTLAFVEERVGDLESSKRAFTEIIAAARDSAEPMAELRALHNLAFLHHEQGELADALAVHRRAAERAGEFGRPWAPYGLDSRMLGGVVAYQLGDWAAADRLLDVSGHAPPPLAEAALAAAAMSLAAGRGAPDGLDPLGHIRPWWARDGLIAVLSGGAAIDLHGDAGRLEAAVAIHAEVVAVVGELWQEPDFQARIRLSALVLGQLSARVPECGPADRADLVRRGSQLVDAAERAAARSSTSVRQRGPEGDAWLARVRAEDLRLRWLAGVDAPDDQELTGAWTDVVRAFERYPHAFELARSQIRLATVLRAAGRRAQAGPPLTAARATAGRLGAGPLLRELAALDPPDPARHGRSSRLDEPLTPREAEVLALVARGRTNRQIGAQLFISTKTASVHVSNILAKLGAAGRTEAAALARRRRLLED